MNVAIEIVDDPKAAPGQSTGATMRKKVVVCTKDFEPGELIFKVSINSGYYMFTLAPDTFRL